jgi:hypothetical protein
MVQWHNGGGTCRPPRAASALCGRRDQPPRRGRYRDIERGRYRERERGRYRERERAREGDTEIQREGEREI